MRGMRIKLRRNPPVCGRVERSEGRASHPGWHVEVFYDGEYPLCLRENKLLKWLDRKHRIRFTDILEAPKRLPSCICSSRLDWVLDAIRKLFTRSWRECDLCVRRERLSRDRMVRKKRQLLQKKLLAVNASHEHETPLRLESTRRTRKPNQSRGLRKRK